MHPTRATHSGPSTQARLAAGSLVQILSRIGVLLLSLVLMGYLTRRLGTAEYGRYAVAIVLMNWLAIGIAAATGGATVRLVVGQKNGRRYAVSMLQMVGMLATLLAVIIALLAEPLAHLLRSPAIAPLLRIDKKARFLDLRHEYLGVQRKVIMKTRSAALCRSDNDQIR